MTGVSVVIPTYNRLGQLQRVLAALERQSVGSDAFEVIVVSDGSTDGSDEYLRCQPTRLRLTPVFQANSGVATARNAGVARAAGELILFLDDDVVPGPTLIAEHLAVHAAEGENVVVLGPMLTPTDFAMSPWVRWEQAMLSRQYDDMVAGRWEPTARQFYTGNTSLARRHVLAAGGFDPAFRRAEDVELAYRLAHLGLRFVYHPAAAGYHYADRSFESWLATPYTYGRNDVVFTREKGQSWLLPTVLHEFRLRKPPIRALTRLCLDRPRLTRATTSSLKLLAGTARLGLSLPARLAYSALFNLRHYQGIADELGGRDAFFAGVAAARVRPLYPGPRHHWPRPELSAASRAEPSEAL
jgi:GT2 family glycosyltransferase